MTDTDAEKNRLRTQILKMLSRVPARIASCSARDASEFKKFHASAMNTINQNRAPLHAWMALHTQTLAQYK